MSFAAGNYRRMVKRMLGPLAKPVTLRVRDGSGFNDHRVMAHVSNWHERDLVPGGTIELGDLRLIIDADGLPPKLRRLETKDRVQIDGRDYAVIHWDTETRALGSDLIAVEATVRG